MSSSWITASCAYCGSRKTYPLQVATGEQLLRCPSCFLKFRVVLQDGQPVESQKLDHENFKQE